MLAQVGLAPAKLGCRCCALRPGGCLKLGSVDSRTVARPQQASSSDTIYIFLIMYISLIF